MGQRSSVRHYHLQQLSVASDLELAHWEEFWLPQAAAGVDQVEIRRGPSPLAPAYSFAIPDLAEFAITTESIRVNPLREARDAELAPYLLGSAWAALAYLRGRVPFHSAAVLQGQEALAFCAPSGGGKSSLLAALGGRGFCDDLGWLELSPQGPPHLWRSSSQMRLCPDAFHCLGYDDAHWPYDSHYRKHTRQLDSTALPRRAPVKAVYLLEWGEPAITRLRGGEALRRLVAAATYRPTMVEDLGLWAFHWSSYRDLAARIPIYAFSRPRDWQRLPESLDCLAEHWRVG